LPWLLNTIFETMLVVLEAAGLTQTRQHLIDRWDSFEEKRVASATPDSIPTSIIWKARP